MDKIDEHDDAEHRAAQPTRQEVIVTVVERDDKGDAIGVKLVRLGKGRLVLTASASAIVISCGSPAPVLAGGDDTLQPTASSRAGGSGDGDPSTAAEYREVLGMTCQRKAAKLERVHVANPDATPIGELVDVLQDQLTQIIALNPPEELADDHARLVAAFKDRVALLSRVSGDSEDSSDQVDALLAQADAFAVQVDDAYRALGVPECAS
jgi:hypothetical protein